MGYQVAAVAVVVLHFVVLGYLVFGGFLAWRWPWAIVAHLVMAGWAVLIVTDPAVWCPLTVAESRLRELAGRPMGDRGFIDTYVTGVLYPVGAVNLVRVLVAVVILGSWLGAVRHRRRVATAGPAGPAGGSAGGAVSGPGSPGSRR
jgi:hypothetical protein